jgi:hypothetical protein
LAANNNPVFTKKGNLTANGGTTMSAGMVTATADFTGVSANHVLAHTSGADGSYIKRIKFVATGTCVASVVRIYLNNGSTNTTATNNQFIGQLSLPAITTSNTTATAEPEYPLEMMIPATFRIYCGLGTTVAASWIPTCVAGDY